MSGIGIQKLNGAGTAMQALNDTITGQSLLLSQIKNAVNGSNKPDLYKLSVDQYGFAKPATYNQFNTLVNNGDFAELPENHFGKYCITLVLHDDDDVGTVEILLKNGLAVVKSVVMHGKDFRNSYSFEYVGVLTTVNLIALRNTITAVDIYIDFIGYNDQLISLPGDNNGGGSTQVQHVLRIDESHFADGESRFDYINPALVGNTHFQIYYLEGSNFLTPLEDFIYHPYGGFSLTYEFGSVQPGQTFILIF